MTNYPLEERVSGEIRNKINQLYHKKKFGRLADVLREKNLWDQAHRSIFLEKVLQESPQQAIRFLHDWTFSSGDYYSITCYSTPYVYEEALKILDEEQRKSLAHVLFDAVPSICDFPKKLFLLLSYRACDRAFWDAMVIQGQENFFDDKHLEGWNIFEECLKQITELGGALDEAVGIDFRTAVLALGDSKMQIRMAEKMSDTDWYALYFSIYDKERSEIHRNYLMLLVNDSPSVALDILPEWQFYSEDFETISSCPNIDRYRDVMQTLNWNKRTILALNFNIFPIEEDTIERMKIILEYRAYCNRFWDKVLDLSKGDNIVAEVLDWLNARSTDKEYSQQMKLLETKIIEKGDKNLLKILFPYLSDEGWIKLSLEQFQYALLFLCPPDRVIFRSMDSDRNGYWQEIVQKLYLKDEVQERLLWPKYFSAFNVYISHQRLSPFWERRIYSESGAKYKKHRTEYQKLYKLSLYKRILYRLRIF